MRKERVGLEHHADVRSDAGFAADVAAGDPEVPRARQFEARDQAAGSWSCRSPRGPRKVTSSPRRIARSMPSTATASPKRLTTPDETRWRRLVWLMLSFMSLIPPVAPLLRPACRHVGRVAACPTRSWIRATQATITTMSTAE